LGRYCVRCKALLGVSASDDDSVEPDVERLDRKRTRQFLPSSSGEAQAGRFLEVARGVVIVGP